MQILTSFLFARIVRVNIWTVLVIQTYKSCLIVDKVFFIRPATAACHYCTLSII